MNDANTPALPRLAPQTRLPDYAFVPGKYPHPISDPSGHSYGLPEVTVSPESLRDWATCEPYLFGIDLFNRGYYWEAHEAWESLWSIAPDADATGNTTSFLKGLIKLSAAGVKLREGNAEGARRHARRADELLRDAFSECDTLLGMKQATPLGIAQHIALQADRLKREAATGTQPRPLFSLLLIELPPS